MSLLPLTRALKNDNYSCYTNVILQLLARSPPILKWSQEYVHSSEGPAEDCIKCILRDTIRKMRKEPLTTPLLPRQLLNWTRGHNGAFQAGEQADPHELLGYLLQQTGLDFFHHEEIEKVIFGLEDDLHERDVTITPPCVGIQMCLGTVSLNEISNKNLLESYFSIENSKSCQDGDGRICVERCMLLTPDILVIVLGRFVLEHNVWIKYTAPCTIDPEITLTTQDDLEFKYKVCGVVERIGATVAEGHYVAKVLDNGKWISYSDDEVCEEQINTADIYMTFYTRITDDALPDASPLIDESSVFNADDATPLFDESVVFNEEGQRSLGNYLILLPDSPSRIAEDFEIDEAEPEDAFDEEIESEEWSHSLSVDDDSDDDWKETFEANKKSWIADLSTEFHLRWMTKDRLLVICLPKTCEGETFQDSYKNFLTSGETLMYTITYRCSKFLRRLQMDPYIKEKYNVYHQTISSKIGDETVSLWVATAAVTYILHTQIITGTPKYEFIFDLNTRSMINQFIIRSWATIKQNIGSIFAGCLATENLFCLDGCSMECLKKNLPFHMSIRRMALMTPPEDTADVSLMHRWSIINHDLDLSDHPLRDILTLPSGTGGQHTNTQEMDQYLHNCEINSSDRCYVYFLMVVDSGSAHKPEDLLKMWLEKTATFSVYAGFTKQRHYRKEHIMFNSGSPVSDILTDTSTVYLLSSTEFASYNEGAIAEAQLIAVLRRFQEEEKKTGIDYKFDILNKNLPAVHLYESNAEMKQKLDRFMETGKPPFRFINEEYDSTENEDGILQRFLVSEVIEIKRRNNVAGAGYVCYYHDCGQSFKTLCGLIRHKRKKHGSNIYKCSERNCKESFARKEDYYEHMLVHADVIYTCVYPGCGRRFSVKTTYTYHKLKHGSTTYTCDYPDCGKTYRSELYLAKHKRQHEVIHECSEEECEMSFPRRELLREHRLREHTEKSYECEFSGCGKLYYDKKTMNEHLKKKHTETVHKCREQGCEEAFSRSEELRQHRLSQHSDLFYQCAFPGCGKLFKTNITRDIHFRLHVAKTFKCTVTGCGETFPRYEGLRQHTLRQHSAKYFECDFPECGKVFKSLESKKSHLKTHKGPFECPEPNCGKLFNRHKNLIIHRRTHDVNVFECPELNCNEAFPSCETLREHTLRKHSEHFYECNFLGCGKVFSTKKRQIKHFKLMHVAKDYKCPEQDCNESFPKHVQLQQHRLRQHAAKYYECTFPGCIMVFKDKSTKNGHLKRHKGEVYKCLKPNCSRVYKQRHNLLAHQRTHHASKDTQEDASAKSLIEQRYSHIISNPGVVRLHDINGDISATSIFQKRYSHIIRNPGVVILHDIRRD